MLSRWIVMLVLGCGLAMASPVWAQQPTDPNCSPANLMLVVDVSGSMSEGNKLEGLKQAILDTVSSFKTSLRLGLISFSGTKATLLVQVGPDDVKDAAQVQAHVDKLKQAVQGLKALGTTPMTAAMKLALSNYQSVLPNDRLHKDPDPKTQRRNFVLLATDGEPTDGDPLPTIKALRSLKIGSKTYDVRTFVVGLGSDKLIRPFQLKQFAVAGGTDDFLQALTPDDLKPFFKKISESASKEVCDGRDNDCDGLVDEDLERACKNDCGTGKQICQKGKWGPCDAPQPKREICNGRDENCNGQVDEGLTRACSTACGKGQQSCIQGDWSSCSAPRPEEEVCDGQDNDCDGQIDNGNLCTGGKCVMQGNGKAICEIPCSNSECPSGYTCDRATNLCVAGPCAKAKCKPGEVCSEKTGKAVCENLCANVQCGAGTTCGRSGTCINCYEEECAPGMICMSGQCILDTCQQKTCDQSQACKINPDGSAACKDTCANTKCADNEYCDEGSCKIDPCKTLNCPAGKYCDRKTSRCIDNACLKGNFSCGNDGKRVCDPLDGVCTDNPCTNLNCPAGTYCHLGQCWENSRPKSYPAGRCAEAKDCGVPGQVCEKGFCIARGEQPTDKACGCSSQPHSPWTSLFWLMGWLLLLGARRQSRRATASS